VSLASREAAIDIAELVQLLVGLRWFGSVDDFCGEAGRDEFLAYCFRDVVNNGAAFVLQFMVVLLVAEEGRISSVCCSRFPRASTAVRLVKLDCADMAKREQ
jgi:hypothetical protein